MFLSVSRTFVRVLDLNSGLACLLPCTELLLYGFWRSNSGDLFMQCMAVACIMKSMNSRVWSTVVLLLHFIGFPVRIPCCSLAAEAVRMMIGASPCVVVFT